jgi:hypothetical protein
MKLFFIFGLILIGLPACTERGASASGEAIDYCRYATSKPEHIFLYGGQGIAGCEVLKSEVKKMDMMGQKLIGHRAEIKLKIEQIEDDCTSKQGLACNVLQKEKSCIRENGKAANFCKYPDAKIVTKKGTFIKEMKRGLELLQEDGGKQRVDVVSNKELK